MAGPEQKLFLPRSGTGILQAGGSKGFLHLHIISLIYRQVLTGQVSEGGKKGMGSVAGRQGGMGRLAGALPINVSKAGAGLQCMPPVPAPTGHQPWQAVQATMATTNPASVLLPGGKVQCRNCGSAGWQA